MKSAFITKPKWSVVTVGDEEIGFCRLPKIGGLVAGEQKAMEECSDSLPDPLAEASLLAVKIQKLHNLPDKDLLFCLAVVSDDGWEEKEKIRINSLLKKETSPEKSAELLTQAEERIELFSRLRLMHWPEIVELNRKLSKSSRIKQDAAITALFKYRAVILLHEELEEATDPEEKLRIKKEITKFEDWSVGNTDLLRDKFKQVLWKFIQQEISADQKKAELTIEDVVKPLGAV